MADRMNDFLDSLEKKVSIEFTVDHKKDMKWISEKVIHPAFKKVKEKIDKRQGMSAEVINSKAEEKDLFENYELIVKDKNSKKLTYSIGFALSDNGGLLINRTFSTGKSLAKKTTSPKTETFELTKATFLTEDLIEDDITKKLMKAY